MKRDFSLTRCFARFELFTIAAALCCMLLFTATATFAKDKAPKAMGAELCPVNVESMRAAIEDTIAEFGPRYPDGPRYLQQLSELAEKQKVVGGASAETKEVDEALKALRSEAMLAHPLLKFGKLLFMKRHNYSASHIYSEHTDGGRELGGNICILSPVAPNGNVTEIIPEFSEGIFGQFDLSFDATKLVFAYKRDKQTSYRIFEVNIDGSDLRPLTFDGDEEESVARYKSYPCYGRYDDVDPCYLPDGRIFFASSRSRRAVSCFPCTVTSMHVMDADGGNVRCLSDGQFTELDPAVMDDGRVVYMRWEYVDKGFGNVQSLWSMHPDGSYSDHVFKNSSRRPAGMVDPRGIPGTTKIVTIGAPHCGPPVGPVILVDNRITRRADEAMTNITPEIGYPDMFQTTKNAGAFRQPYPLSDKLFLVSYSPHNPQLAGPGHYGLCVLDKWGNRTDLYLDRETSCFQPIPLRPRRKPTEVAKLAEKSVAAEDEIATMFMQDVYRGLTGIQRGRVKYIRVMEALVTTWDEGQRANKHGDTAGLQSAAVSHKADVGRKKIYGIAKVHEDGSACFTVPARRNLFFQALDEDFMELQRMRTFVNLMPGEARSCIGCHESRRSAPDATPAMAMRHPIQALTPQPGDSGPRMVHYEADVQPTLDKHCVGCHGGAKPEGGLDLSGELTGLWNRSYENLIEKRLVSQLNGGYGAAYVEETRPLSFGSHKSKLVERIRKAPCKSDLTREEFIKIVTWIDSNVPYYGTHDGKKNIKWKDEPDFRPLPLVAK